MPVCNISNPTWRDSPVIHNNPIDVEFNLTKNSTLHFELENNQTVYFLFNLVSLTPNMITNIQIGIYKIGNIGSQANTFTLIANLNSNSTTIISNIDLATGVYVVCMRSLMGSYKGTAKADYYGYSAKIQFIPNSYSGDFCNFDLTIKPREKPCDKEMKWELIEGSLPKGITLEKFSGMLHGNLPYLDCLNDDEDYKDPFKNIPSVNMFYTTSLLEDEGQTIEPWGRRWKFKLRISIVDQPQHFDEKWFCLVIYNDWSRSTEKFFSTLENNIINENKIITKNEEKVKFGLCPPDENIIEKEVNEIIDELEKDIKNTLLENNKDFIDNNNNIDIEDDIMYLELKEDDTGYIEYTKNSGKYDKNIYKNLDNDNKKIKGLYGDFETTLDLNEEELNDILEMLNTTPQEMGFVSETIDIEIESYEHFLGFRQYAIENINLEMFDAYRDSKLFKDFLNSDLNVEYDYYNNIPQLTELQEDEEIDFSDEELDDDFEIKHFIEIYYKDSPLPEVKYIEEVINNVKKDAPNEMFLLFGEEVKFELDFKY